MRLASLLIFAVLVLGGCAAKVDYTPKLAADMSDEARAKMRAEIKYLLSKQIGIPQPETIEVTDEWFKVVVSHMTTNFLGGDREAQSKVDRVYYRDIHSFELRENKTNAIVLFWDEEKDNFFFKYRGKGKENARRFYDLVYSLKQFGEKTNHTFQR